MITKLLSTVKMVRYEDHNKVVIGRIERDKRGICRLIGQKPNYPHWQIVTYFDDRAEDASFVVPTARRFGNEPTAPAISAVASSLAS